MPPIIISVLRLAAFLFLLIAPVQVAVNAQTIHKTKPDFFNKLGTIRNKASFTLLKPSQVNQFGDPCELTTQIAFGQTINGSITPQDCQLDDGSYADFYTFNGSAGQTVTINMVSNEIDTYLGLANLSGTFTVEDDDGGGGTNAQISTVLPETGIYIILANSYEPETFGNYNINLTGSQVCTFTFSPTSQTIPGAGGTFSFQIINPEGCFWRAETDSHALSSITSSGTGSGTIFYTASPNTGDSDRSMIIRINNIHTFTITQPFITCTYSINPQSAHHGPDAVQADFSVITPEGCPWSAQDSAGWISTSNALRRGPGQMEYQLIANNGADRSGTITVAGNVFNVSQSGRNCTYNVNPQSVFLRAPGTSNGIFTVETQPGCTWNFGYYGLMEYPDGGSGVGSGSVRYRVYANHQYIPRTWRISFSGNNSFYIPFTQLGIPFRTRFDFFGDSKADLSLYRPSTGQWFVQDSVHPATTREFTFGLSDDLPVPADYNGDRKTDIAVFRNSDGTWHILDWVSGTYSAFQFGISGDIPAVGDYDGDSKADIAVFRPSEGLWYILRSSDQQIDIIPFGLSGDKPVPADYDNDGKIDIAIFRPSVGEWWIRQSNDGQAWAAQFGNSDDIPVPGDHSGDGRADVAIWRPSNGSWYILRSEDYSYYSFPFGIHTDIPAPADYDADGVIDAAVFRSESGVWYIKESSGQTRIIQFGISGDTPIPSPTYLYY